MSDILAIKRAMEGRAEDIARKLLPSGKREGREWCVGSIHGEPGKSLKVCISGEKVGVWQDFAAGIGGDLIDLWREVRGDDLPDVLEEIRGYLGMDKPVFEKRQKEYKRPDYPFGNEPKSAVLDYLTKHRKLTKETIKRFQVAEDHREIVFKYFIPGGTLAFVKHLGLDRDNGKKKIRASAGCEPVLFGWQALDPNCRTIAITEGEIDAMSLSQYGISALSVPFGGGKGSKQGNWIEAEYDRLAQFEKIYLVMDNDEEGDAGAQEITDRLGAHRCYRVRLPMKDANECLKSGIKSDDINKCFEKAKTFDPPELTRAGQYADEVVELFWPTGDKEPGYMLPWDKLVFKVHIRPGEVSIWTGATGAGKSQMLSHAVVHMARQGAKVCIASLEMQPKQLIRRMVKQSGNVDRPSEPFARKIIEWMDNWCWMFAVVGKSPLQRMLDVFEYARARYGCDTFIVDSVMRLGVGSEDYQGQEKAIFDIVSWAVEKNVHVHVVAHARKVDQKVNNGAPGSEDIKGASEIGSNAFNIFGVYRNRDIENKISDARMKAERGDLGAEEQLEKLLSYPPVSLNVAKQRNGDFEGKIGLWFNQETYQYYGHNDEKHGIKYVKMEG